MVCCCQVAAEMAKFSEKAKNLVSCCTALHVFVRKYLVTVFLSCFLPRKPKVSSRIRISPPVKQSGKTLLESDPQRRCFGQRAANVDFCEAVP